MRATLAFNGLMLEAKSIDDSIDISYLEVNKGELGMINLVRSIMNDPIHFL